jgi:ribosomal protein S14
MLFKDIAYSPEGDLEVIKCARCDRWAASRPVHRGVEDTVEKQQEKKPQVMDTDKQADAAGLPPDAGPVRAPKHITGPKPAKAKPKYKGKKQIKPCARCGKERPVVSRGLCGSCYRTVKNQGKLDELYPAIRRAKKQAKPDAEKQKCETPGRMPLQLGKSHIITVPLHFNLDEPRDADLHRRLVEAADVDRRTMPAEIMTLLEPVTSDE